MNLYQGFATVATQHPDKTALVCEGTTLTYSELQRLVLQQRDTLLLMQVRPQERIAYLGLNSTTALVLLLASMAVEAIYVPLNYRLSPIELQAIVDDAGISHLVSDAVHEPVARTLQLGRAHDHWACPGDAMLVYTSGTTGKPRGAVHTHAGMWHNILAASESQDISAKDVVLAVLPLFHVGGLCIQTLPALYAGATVIVHPRFLPQAWLEALVQHEVTISLMVPATLQAVLALPWPRFPALRYVATGSSIVPKAMIEAAFARDMTITQVYGATETGPVSIVLHHSDANNHMGSVGKPAPGVSAQLLNLNAEGVGDLVITAPNVARAYWGQTHSDLSEQTFYTGDLARIDSNGFTTIVGRSKDLIISGGENIYPAEIEQLLAQHPQIKEVAVCGLPDSRWGEVAVAFVVLDVMPEAQSSIDFEAFLAGKLAKYKWPKHTIYLPALPKTALGKVQKSSLVTMHG